VPVAKGEKVLAWSSSADGQILAGTRDAFYAVDDDGEALRVPWEQVEAAEWDSEAGVLRVAQVGTWGEQRPVHAYTLGDPLRLLQLVRERVTASVVLQRHVAIEGRRGVRVIARRAPRGDQPVQWVYEYDEGIDPSDPAVRRVAAELLATARADTGLV
jgi:hypothetical protein